MSSVPSPNTPNLAIRNDRIFNNLRVRKALKLPHAPKHIINPNIPTDPAAHPVLYMGSNNPNANPTLRKRV